MSEAKARRGLSEAVQEITRLAKNGALYFAIAFTVYAGVFGACFMIGRFAAEGPLHALFGLVGRLLAYLYWIPVLLGGGFVLSLLVLACCRLIGVLARDRSPSASGPR